MRLAVIPARGGSKRIPRKNIKPFCGRPIIAWSIEAARQSGCFDSVIVSTEDDEIAEVARAFGADVPFRRPAELADDFTPTIPIIRHAIEWCERAGTAPQETCCIYATAPFVRPEDLRGGLELLGREGCDYAFSVTSYPSPIQRAMRIDARGRVEMFHPELFNTRSQDLEPAYHDAAQFYWGRAEAWKAQKVLFGPHASALVLPRHRVQDIDTMEDWTRAEWMYEALRRAGLP